MLKQPLFAVTLGVVGVTSLGLLAALVTGASVQERTVLPANIGGGGARCLAFSPDSTLLALPDNRGGIIIWDVLLGKPRHILKGHSNNVTKLTFAPDGITLITAFTLLDKTPASVVKHWDVVTGQEKLSFVLKGGGANRALSPDGRILVTVQGFPNKTAKVWNLTTRKEIASLEGDSHDVLAAAVAPDGKLVALGGRSNEIKLFELPSGKPRGALKQDRDGVTELAFSRDGRLLTARSGVPPRATFWDVASGKEIAFSGRWRPVGSPAAFAPDGELVAIPWNGVQLWSLPGRARLAELPARNQRLGGHPILFSPDGRLVAMGGSTGLTGIWDVPELNPLARGIRLRQTFKVSTGEVACVAFSPDCKTAVFATGAGEMKLWDVARGKELTSLGGSRFGTAASFSPDGQLLATTAVGEPACLWDMASRKVRTRLRGSAAGSRFVAFGPDGKTVATAEADDAIRLWDSASGELLTELRGEARQLTVLAFSPDGKTLASAALKGGVALWEVAARKERVRLTGLTDPVVSLAWTPDSKTLATSQDRVREGKETVLLWDAAQGQVRKRLPLRPSMIRFFGLAFSPDGQTLAVVGSGGWVHLWDIASGRLIAELVGQTSFLKCVAFSPDGRILACGGQDGTVRLWELPALNR